MLNINNKFEIGQEVYLIEKKQCPVCNGKGSFYHNGYYIECPKCKANSNGQYIVAEGTYFSVFCVMRSVIYVQRVSDMGKKPYYELEEILKHYRKIEIMGGGKEK